MNRQVDVKALISHIVRGDGADRCRICMGDTTEGQVLLEDTVMLDGDRPITLAELLETLTGVEVRLILKMISLPIAFNSVENGTAKNHSRLFYYGRWLCKIIKYFR